MLPYHVCLSAISVIRKGLLGPSSYCNYSTTKPQNIPDRNHGSRLEVMSSWCNYSTTTPQNIPDRNHEPRLDVMSDGKRWRDSAVHVPTQTEPQGRRLIVTYIPYVIIPARACTVTAFPDYQRRSRRRIACCSSGRDMRSLCPPPCCDKHWRHLRNNGRLFFSPADCYPCGFAVALSCWRTLDVYTRRAYLQA